MASYSNIRQRMRISSTVTRPLPGMERVHLRPRRYHAVILTGVLLFLIAIFSQQLRVVKNDLPPANNQVGTKNSLTLSNNNCLPDLVGTKVLVLGIHLYGNLGDEMETTPMLQELKKCGILTTGVLGVWSPPDLGVPSVREHGLFERIITVDDEEFLKQDYYHAVIFAPGPWSLKDFRKRYQKQWPNSIDIFFAGSIIDAADKEMGEIITKNYNPSLVVTREKHSLEKFKTAVQPFDDFQTNLMCSSDLSHSFDYSEASFQFWKKLWEKENLAGKKVMFIRDNNWRTESYEILRDSRQVKILTIEKNHVLLDADDIIFATTASSGEKDAILFEWMKSEYKDIFRPDQFRVLDIVEKAWALIAVSKEVITDRCEFFPLC